jgi:hypothetical protein
LESGVGVASEAEVISLAANKSNKV